MIPHDAFGKYNPEQWEKDRAWIVNRSLFLLNVRDSDNERFYGGDDTPEPQKTERSFAAEFEALMTTYPRMFNRAFKIWTDDWGTEKISYVEGL